MDSIGDFSWGGGGGLLCAQPTQMCEYESDGHGSVFGSKLVK